AVPYGGEFWRRASKSTQSHPKDSKGLSVMIPANIELGDIIDRVSHAITKEDPSAVPRVQAKTYAAAFDDEGMHFSPHRAGTSEPPPVNPQVGMRDESRDTANEIRFARASSPSAQFHENEQGLLTSAATVQPLKEQTM